MDHINAREFDAIYRETLPLTLERWPGRCDERSVAGRRKPMVWAASVFVVVAAPCLMAPDLIIR